MASRVSFVTANFHTSPSLRASHESDSKSVYHCLSQLSLDSQSVPFPSMCGMLSNIRIASPFNYWIDQCWRYVGATMARQPSELASFLHEPYFMYLLLASSAPKYRDTTVVWISSKRRCYQSPKMLWPKQEYLSGETSGL